MVKDRFTVELDLEQKMCEDCLCRDESFYVYLIQIRYPSRFDLKEEVESILKQYNELINKYEDKDNGIDIFLRKNISTKRIVSRLQKKYLVVNKIDATLVGMDFLRSKKKYRTTCLINIVDLFKGDLITFKGKEYILKTYFKDSLTLISKEKGNKKTITYNINKSFIRKVEN